MKAVGGLAADALGGGIGSDEIGISLFEGLQAAHEQVVLSVGQDGSVEDVVQVLVVAKLIAELGDFVR